MSNEKQKGQLLLITVLAGLIVGGFGLRGLLGVVVLLLAMLIDLGVITIW